MSSAHGFSVPDREPPDMTPQVRKEIEGIIVDAAAAVDTNAERAEVARRSFRAIEDAVRTYVADSTLPEGQREDLVQITRSTKVSRAAITTSPAEDAPGLVRSRVIDNLRTWHLIGDWNDRDLTAAEVIVRLHEEGANFDPTNNYADRMLLERAREEQEPQPRKAMAQ